MSDDEPATPDPRDRRDDGLQDARDDSDPTCYTSDGHYEHRGTDGSRVVVCDGCGRGFPVTVGVGALPMHERFEDIPDDEFARDDSDPGPDIFGQLIEHHRAYGPCDIPGCPFCVGTLDVDDDGLDPITGGPPHWGDR